MFMFIIRVGRSRLRLDLLEHELGPSPPPLILNMFGVRDRIPPFPSLRKRKPEKTKTPPSKESAESPNVTTSPNAQKSKVLTC